jgi:hypothetical protein
MAPKGTPAQIVNRLNAEIAKIQNRPMCDRNGRRKARLRW